MGVTMKRIIKNMLFICLISSYITNESHAMFRRPAALQHAVTGSRDQTAQNQEPQDQNSVSYRGRGRGRGLPPRTPSGGRGGTHGSASGRGGRQSMHATDMSSAAMQAVMQEFGLSEHHVCGSYARTGRNRQIEESSEVQQQDYIVGEHEHLRLSSVAQQFFDQIDGFIRHRATQRDSATALDQPYLIRQIGAAYELIKSKKQFHLFLFQSLCSAVTYADALVFETLLQSVTDLQVFFWYNTEFRTLVHEVVLSVLKGDRLAQNVLILFLKKVYDCAGRSNGDGLEMLEQLLKQRTLRTPGRTVQEYAIIASKAEDSYERSCRLWNQVLRDVNVARQAIHNFEQCTTTAQDTTPFEEA